MTPCYYEYSFDYPPTRNAIVFDIYSSGRLSDNLVTNADKIRPVINLKVNTQFEIGGMGTSTNPYIVIGAE